LLGLDLHPFDQSADDLAPGRPIRVLQTLHHPLRKRLQVTEDQPQCLLLQRPRGLLPRPLL
jgi:hypothetical protein